MPERTYLISIINTLNPDATKKVVEQARDNRSISQSDDLGNLVKNILELLDALKSTKLQKSKIHLSNLLHLSL